jgi:hypothetical protein
MLVYALTIFLSAFLLFQVQPIIAKAILPWFGGTSAVWTTCMLFFQVTLLLGYAYAHWLHERLRPAMQGIVHILLLAASLAVLPILPAASWKPSGAENPSLRILMLLGLTIGLPYLLLSTTSPLMQAWYARTHKQGLPYRWYALSNLGSMLALLSYPVLVEPYLATRHQGQVWSAAYAVFVVLCGTLAWRARKDREPGDRISEIGGDSQYPSPVPAASRLLWIALAACASILLLAVTNYLTQNVAAIPFLWVLPLSVYLLSFIVCFEAPRVYRRAVFLPLLAVAVAGMAYFVWQSKHQDQKVPLAVAVFVSSLFVCSMVCHGELAARKPHPRHLTGFYLMVALGGALGGTFVGLAAPYLFSGYYEFPIGMALTAALAVVVVWTRVSIPWRVAMAVALAGYLVFLGVVVRDDVKGYTLSVRNFYGQLRIWDDNDDFDLSAPSRMLLHGTIIHGQQMRDQPYRRQAVSYFCPESGIGRLMRAGVAGVPRRIGILGLGCGTLAAYGRPGDTIRIYEINPLVPGLAQREFSYLRDTPARVEIQMGDGRLSLEREPSQQFDVLVMDAFSGDSVPVHLLTREAFQTYFRHLKPGGVLAVNITNTYLDLRPVLASLAANFGKLGLVFDLEPDEQDFLCYTSSWVLVMNPSARDAFRPWLDSGATLASNRPFRLWTDDYSNLWGILR